MTPNFLSVTQRWIRNENKIVRYIPLGSNCVVAYQLQVLKLRTEAYSFDWLKFKRMSQVVDVLEKDFMTFRPLTVQTHLWLHREFQFCHIKKS